MKRLLVCLLLAGVVGCGGPTTEEEAIAALKKLETDFVLSNKEVAGIRYKITDAGLVHLKGLAGLQTLDLTDNHIGDEGVGYLAEALPQESGPPKSVTVEFVRPSRSNGSLPLSQP